MCKPVEEDLTMAKHKPPRRRPSPYRTYGIIGFVTIFAIVGGLLASGSTITVYTWWLGLGIATWVLYFVDKLLAKGEGRSRVPELVLLGMVIIGGWGGGLLSTLVWPRHKRRHWYFIVIPLLAAVVHLGVAWRVGWM
jgi:uncharacterized membrane protein YsdA (DUF1294 family)